MVTHFLVKDKRFAPFWQANLGSLGWWSLGWPSLTTLSALPATAAPETLGSKGSGLPHFLEEIFGQGQDPEKGQYDELEKVFSPF